MMFRGRGRLGDTTTPAPPTASAGGFLTGAELWETPGAAFTAAQGVFTNASASFSSSNLPYTLGILAVPAALLLLILSMGKGRR